MTNKSGYFKFKSLDKTLAYFFNSCKTDSGFISNFNLSYNSKHENNLPSK